MMMNKRLFNTIGVGLLLLLAGCGKDDFATKPSLKFKSISSYDVANRGTFEIRLEYTDAEGDLSIADSALTIIRTVARCPAATINFRYQLPTIPATRNSSGDIVIKYAVNTPDYTNQGYTLYPLGTCNVGTRPDTTSFRFFIRDKAGHVSDTVQLDRPVLIRRQ
jgi:hypothetical protein